MKNAKAIKVLREIRDGIAPDKQYAGQVAEAREAIALAIAALKDPMLDHRKAGIRGGKAVFKKFGRKEMSRRGKLGGRPRKKVA